MRHDFPRRAGHDDLTAGIATFGAEVDQPVGSRHHVQVVLDDQHRMSRGDQLTERSQQLGDVIEVQTGRWLIEQKQRALPGRFPCAARRLLLGNAHRLFTAGEMACQLEPLRFATRQRRHRLSELEVIESDIRQWLESFENGRLAREELHRIGDRHIEHIRDARRRRGIARRTRELHLENFAAITTAVAIRTTQIHIRQKLHLHMLESIAAARRTATVAAVEAERTDRVVALFGERLGCKEFADDVERAYITCRVGTCGATDGRLIDHHDIADVLDTLETRESARRFGRLAESLAQRRIQNVLDQGGLARPRNTGHADQSMQRQLDIDVLEIVFARAANADHGVRIDVSHCVAS